MQDHHLRTLYRQSGSHRRIGSRGTDWRTWRALVKLPPGLGTVIQLAAIFRARAASFACRGVFRGVGVFLLFGWAISRTAADKTSRFANWFG